MPAFLSAFAVGFAMGTDVELVDPPLVGVELVAPPLVGVRLVEWEPLVGFPPPPEGTHSV